jgi:hypothetical protein
MLIEQAKDKKTKKMIINMMIQDSTLFEFNESYSIYEKWKTGEITKNDAIKYLGNLYATNEPSGCPTDVTYPMYWEISYQNETPDGSQNRTKLLTELKKTFPSLQFSNENANLKQDALFIYRLPINGKVIFIDLNTFEKAIKNGDPEQLFPLIKNGLHYGNITVRPGIEPYIKIAESTFHQDELYHKIEYEFKNSGHVFDLRVQSFSSPIPLSTDNTAKDNASLH